VISVQNSPSTACIPEPPGDPVSSQSLLEKFCLIGQPIAGNPTHYMVEQAIRQAGVDVRFLTFEVGADDFGDAMRGIRALGLRGVKITNPHRETVLQYVDQATDHARLAGAANCIIRDKDLLIAENTLGQSVVTLLGEVQEKTAVILGAGPVARAVAAALALAGAGKIIVVNRSDTTSKPLVDTLNSETSAEAISQIWADELLAIDPQCDFLIHATSLGTTNPDKPLPIDLETVRPNLVVVDVSYNQPQTWLICEAQERGCQTINGLEIFVEQTSLALRLWSDIDANRTAMLEAAEEYLVI
jgi:shikimate dehydrogenase